jgi:hypothetical protein
VVNIALSLPLALAGILADRVGINAVLVGMSVLIGLVALWVSQMNRKIFLDAAQ